MPGSVSEDAEARPPTPNPLRRAVRQRCGFQAAGLPRRDEDPRPGTGVCLSRAADAGLRSVGSFAAARTAGNRMAALGARTLEAGYPMIDKREILEAASALGLLPNVVEKDYVLGWVLAGIHAHPELTNYWIFKGGTCLKKCYFETYRFSEDLDFTLLDGSHVNEALLLEIFSEITQWIYGESGIEFPDAARTFEIYANPRGKN